jgi:cysteinyl-tRNA synthetase
MVPFKLFNTVSQSVEALIPLQENLVSIYTCGPTVYGNPHIGNLRTYIAEDLLVRSLKLAGYQVHRVMNITDVGHLTSDGDEGEDKLEVGAKRDGTTAWEVAKRYEKVFLDDMIAFNLLPADQLVRATDTITEQISLIQTLESKGFTYTTSDGVYFDSSKFPQYGDFARLDIAGLEAGARVDLGEKRAATDFALWKFSPQDSKRDMEWESPWGKGFPGWHIECSAIIHKTLGNQIDIHCGGVDHIPVHHTNEIAQSTAATGEKLANIWMHTEFLLVDGGKMSKSLGNLFTLSDLQERGIEPEAFKLFCYGASYRSKLNFSWESLSASQHRLNLWRNRYSFTATSSGGDVQQESRLSNLLDEFKQALFTDLNTAVALSVVEKAYKEITAGEVLRQFLQDVDAVLGLNLTKEVAPIILPPEHLQMKVERDKARASRDWETSDKIRKELEDLGYQVQDRLDGTHIF